MVGSPVSGPLSEVGSLSSSNAFRNREFTVLFRRFYVAASALALTGTLGVASVFWVFGDDPATAPASESEDLRNTLIPLRQIPIGDFVYLNASSDHRWILGPGFALAEDDGTWVRAREAEIIFYPRFGAETDASDFEVELSMSPLLAGGATSRSVTVTSSAETVTVALPEGGARVSLALAPIDEQIIRISCDDLDAPPSALEMSDLRRLCVKVYALAVRVGGAG